MRWIALLVVAGSLVLAVVGAVTAYLPRLDLPDQMYRYRDESGTEQYLHLNAPAGVEEVEGKRVPIGLRKQELTPELRERLRAANVGRVRVREFSFARWDRWWIFAVGCVGLLLGGLMLRSLRRVVLTPAGAAVVGTPEQALAEVVGGLEALESELAGTQAAEARLAAVMSRVAALQAGPVAGFIAGRPALVARLGIGGYAQLMDRFAAGERKLNRAWSAAADGHLAEARASLKDAGELLRAARGWLAERDQAGGTA